MDGQQQNSCYYELRSTLPNCCLKMRKKPLQGTMLITVAKVEARMPENLLFNSIFSCVYNYDVSHYNYMRWVHVTIVRCYEATVTSIWLQETWDLCKRRVCRNGTKYSPHHIASACVAYHVNGSRDRVKHSMVRYIRVSNPFSCSIIYEGTK